MATLPASAISLFHFENNLTDTLGNATATNSGVTLSTTQKKFGSYAAYVNGTISSGSYVTLSLSALTTYTVAMWLYRATSATTNWWPAAFCASDGTNSGVIWHTSDTSNNTPIYIVKIASQNTEVGSTAIPTNSWCHAAITRSGSTYKFYLNGTLQKTITNTGTMSLSQVILGVFKQGSTVSSDTYFNGYIDELLITNDVLWTANFTPPTDAYVDPVIAPAKSLFFGMNF